MSILGFISSIEVTKGFISLLCLVLDKRIRQRRDVGVSGLYTHVLALPVTARHYWTEIYNTPAKTKHLLSVCSVRGHDLTALTLVALLAAGLIGSNVAR